MRWRRLSAIFLVLWWGGLNCLTGCAMAMPDADHCATESALAAAVETDAEVSDNCCAVDRECHESGETALSLLPVPALPSAPQLDCCALENHQANTEPGARVGARSGEAPRPIGFSADASTGKTSIPRFRHLPDRGGTHLRHCLFQI